MRYVDAEKELAEMKFAWYPQDMDTTNAIGMYEDFLKNAPSADVAPVKHAHWKWDENGMDWGIGAWVCSNCGLMFPDVEVALKENAHIRKYAYANYCGCCGARMDEKGIRLRYEL